MTDEILINTEAMNSVNKSVLNLKEKLTDIPELSKFSVFDDANKTVWICWCEEDLVK